MGRGARASSGVVRRDSTVSELGFEHGCLVGFLISRFLSIFVTDFCFFLYSELLLCGLFSMALPLLRCKATSVCRLSG